MSDPYRYLPLDGHPHVTRDDVLAAWVGEGALDEPTALRRLDEVLLVASTAGGELAAISTAYVELEPQLGLDLWFFRTYTVAAHRRTWAAQTLAVHVIEHLVARWEAGTDRRGAGVAMRMENDDLRRAFPEADWYRLGGMLYVTRRPGSDLRVRYFPGALAPDPPRAT